MFASLELINNYFFSKMKKNLMLKYSRPNDIFHILYLNTLRAFAEKKSLQEILMQNYRVYKLLEPFDSDLNSLNSNFIRFFRLNVKKRYKDLLKYIIYFY